MEKFSEFAAKVNTPLSEAQTSMRGEARSVASSHIQKAFREYGVKGNVKFVDNKSNFISRAEVPVNRTVFGILTKNISDAKLIITESFFNTGGKKTVYTVELSVTVGSKEVSIDLGTFTVSFKTMVVSAK